MFYTQSQNNNGNQSTKKTIPKPFVFIFFSSKKSAGSIITFKNKNYIPYNASLFIFDTYGEYQRSFEGIETNAGWFGGGICQCYKIG